MSLWLHAAAGGLQGLGTSITAADTEKREARGMALREKYLTARQGKEHTFRSVESEKSRTHQTELTNLQIEATDKRTMEGRTHDLELEDIRSSSTMERLEAQLKARSTEGNAYRRAAMERTLETINAGIKRETAAGGLRQYNALLEETLERAGKDPDPDSFDADGNAIANWKLYDELLTITALAKGVPPWRQPVRTAPQIVEYAQELGSLDAAVAALKEHHYRVPDRAITQARNLAAPRLLTGMSQ